MKKLLLTLLVLSVSYAQAQDYFPTNTGVKTTENTTIAFKNATIYVSPKQVIKKGMLLVKNGKVVNVGRSISVPKGTKIVDVSGKTIYPSFVEVYSNFGVSKPKSSSGGFGRSPQYDASRSGFYWNDHVRPETDASKAFKFDVGKAKSLLKSGFGVVNTHVEDGIIRGSGMLVALNSNANDAYRILDSRSAQYSSFSRSRASRQGYPNSIMGSMALIRQMYMDADWYAGGNAKNKDLSLEALNNNKELKQIFDSGGSYLNVLRADKIGDELGIQYTIIGSGYEYERINDIRKTNATLVIPINFRKPYDVSNSLLANQIAISDMRRWNQEPSNPAVLAKNGVTFAFTTYRLKSPTSFLKNLRKAVQYGLDKTKALEALTTVPAQILGNTKIGNLQKGSHANFMITSSDIFDSSTTMYEHWVQGKQNVINPMDVKDITGNYTLYANGKNYDLIINGKDTKQRGTIKLEGKTVKSKFSFKDDWLQIVLNENGSYSRLTGRVTDGTTIKGSLINNYGNESTWSATKKANTTTHKKAKNKSSKIPEIVSVSYPNVGFGNYVMPKQETILFKNATVWTGEKEGILKNTDVLIKNGKISKIGKNLSASGAKVIDATGKHVTAGIIDEHSHIAASSINEAGHNSSAEVTIEDVIDPDDISIYRNLAGGVTSIQILHGSANPIGGQSAIIKLKWGENANGLIYDNSPKFIKFALGENVKQSGSSTSYRFPKTRMGVEQVYMDYFTRAKEYDTKKKSGQPYRKDLEMEALAEILNKERFISCHSYVQSEINMLMKVAEKFNFNINTFTHILEGYKVADKMKKHGVGGSTFSDWWAYKYEVKDAIPYNASVMHKLGITVAINSDDAEMSRRLNQEAAKAVKYGGVSEEEAWKMVTINPAKLLHLDKRTGSLKVGKDADVVMWSGNPLSIYSKAEKTLIDGAVYFDIDKDLQKRNAIKKERNKLINMMLQEKMGGGKTQAPKKKQRREFHCDTDSFIKY